jgi:hypothetical protein
MEDSEDKSSHGIDPVELSLKAHDRYGKKHLEPEGPFKTISDRFDPKIKEILSDFGKKKLQPPFEIEGPYIDYCFERMKSGVVREVVWRIKSDKYYPVEAALNFKRTFFGLKTSHFAIRGLKGGHSVSKPDIEDLRNALHEAVPFAFVKNRDTRHPDL